MFLNRIVRSWVGSIIPSKIQIENLTKAHVFSVDHLILRPLLIEISTSDLIAYWKNAHNSEMNLRIMWWNDKDEFQLREEARKQAKVDVIVVFDIARAVHFAD